jgi:hypothetical protein
MQYVMNLMLGFEYESLIQSSIDVLMWQHQLICSHQYYYLRTIS